LHELDGVGVENTDVFVLGATNHPWDIDPALRRPGRFDRTVLVLPPDQAAREAIFRTHLSDRPIAGIDPHRLATLTDGFTGADIAHVCDSAAERALSDAIRSGERRMIEMRDLEAAAREVRPSAGPWFEVAKNVVTFANTDGTYDELRDYMKKKGMA
jgi:SpoVK/Ycf46/Vps4 family AAA+-type ATPase